MAMWIGSLTLDLRFGDVRSLKEKRSLVRPIVAELRRKFAVSAAETGNHDLHRRAEVGVAVVAADRAHCVEVISACEDLVVGRPELEVLSAWVRYFSDGDLLSEPGILRSEADPLSGGEGPSENMSPPQTWPGNYSANSSGNSSGNSSPSQADTVPGDGTFPGRGTLAGRGNTDGEGR